MECHVLKSQVYWTVSSSKPHLAMGGSGSLYLPPLCRTSVTHFAHRCVLIELHRIADIVRSRCVSGNLI
jgi:hypothetical protein